MSHVHRSRDYAYQHWRECSACVARDEECASLLHVGKNQVDVIDELQTELAELRERVEEYRDEIEGAVAATSASSYVVSSEVLLDRLDGILATPNSSEISPPDIDTEVKGLRAAAAQAHNEIMTAATALWNVDRLAATMCDKAAHGLAVALGYIGTEDTS